MKYLILPKVSPLPSLTPKFLHRYVYKPRPLCGKNGTISKNECLAIDKNTVIQYEQFVFFTCQLFLLNIMVKAWK